MNKNNIYEMIKDINWHRIYGKQQFNKKVNYYEGYIDCLYENKIITKEIFYKYCEMLRLLDFDNLFK